MPILIVCFAILVLFGLCVTPVARAQEAPNYAELYTQCSFYPQPGVCEAVYAHARTESDIPAAASALAEYENYARYLQTDARSLNDDDKSWLAAKAVTLPDILTPRQLGGLHAVLGDSDIPDEAARQQAVTRYLYRAVQAHMYCVLHACAEDEIS